MPSLGFPELILILVIALILFGPGKLPSVGSAIGKALNEFKKASRELTSDEPLTTKEDNNK
jgi:sec-independent protein translocase protein TatA